jgi:hypothetical protein
MSVAEHRTAGSTHDARRRTHAAVAALVGGPYPNLVTPPATGADGPAAGPAAPVSPAVEGGAPVDLRPTGGAGLPAGGPYPNL